MMTSRPESEYIYYPTQNLWMVLVQTQQLRKRPVRGEEVEQTVRGARVPS